MVQSISFGGLASGLDTTAIINALVGAREIPMNLVQQKKSVSEGKLSLVNSLKSLVQAVQDKANELKTLSGFMSNIITPSEEGVASFSVTGNPTSGSHTLIVNSLATAAKMSTSTAIADNTAALDGGTISFDYNGTNYSVVIDPAASSIDDIAAAINDQAGTAVEATVINTGTSSSPNYELVLSGKDSGADYAIQNLAVAGSPGLADNLAFNGTPLVPASNAEVVIDGLTVQREDNEFSDVVPGLSITALAADSTKTISFGVSVDQDGIKEKLTEFVDTYNAVMDFVNTQNQFSEDGGPGGALFGDGLLSTVRSKLYGGFVRADLATVQADTTGFSALSLLGIKSTVDGTLEIDDAKLTEKMTEDIDAFANFFAADGTGDFARLADGLDYLLDSTGTDINGGSLDSLFEIRAEGLNTTIADYTDTIENMQFSLDKYQESLVQKYANLEVLMSQLQGQGFAVDNLSSLNFG
jgi:flagellar hook-associated protein 2